MNKHFCVDCGKEVHYHEQTAPCSCGSERAAPESVLVGIFGEDWADFAFSSAPLLVCNYGGGENSVAVLIKLHEAGLRPAAIVQADPGHEWRRTTRFRDEKVRPWLAKIGFPDIVVVSRESEAEHNPRSHWKGSLGDDCYNVSSKGHAGLPSVAFGLTSCSQKFKTEPMHWYLQRQEWVKKEWAEGRRLTRIIGYDSDETKRVAKHRHTIAGRVFSIYEKQAESRKYVPSYPIYDAGMSRQDCIELNKAVHGSNPGKSACTFCANNELEEWEELAREEPDSFEYAVEMERRAEPHLTSPATGLMRCNEQGKRRLHVFQNGGYGNAKLGTVEVSQGCDCASD